MSEKVSITKSKLDSLANAIAAVGETSIPKTLSQMESAVLELTPDITSLTVNPTESQQVFTGAYPAINLGVLSFQKIGTSASFSIDLSEIEYGETYHIQCDSMTVGNDGQYYNYIKIDTDWVASENGTVPFEYISHASWNVTSIKLSKSAITVAVSTGRSTIVNIGGSSAYTSTDFIVSKAGTVDGYNPVTVNAMPSGTAGTPTATKGTVSNHSVSITPSVTNATGYITGGTKTGTAVTVNVAELESGTKTITENGTGISVSGYSAVDVDVPGQVPTGVKYVYTDVDGVNAYNVSGFEKVSVDYAGLLDDKFRLWVETTEANTTFSFSVQTSDKVYCNADWGDGASEDFVSAGSSAASTVGTGYSKTISHTYAAPGRYCAVISSTGNLIGGITCQNNSYLKGVEIASYVSQWYSSNLFNGCPNLESITFPASNTDTTSTPSRNTCTDLPSLKRVVFNSPASSIPCFGSDVSLEELTLPGTVGVIDGSTFSGCKSLRRVNGFGTSSITTLPQYIFENCSSLLSVTIPQSITSFQNSTFSGSSIMSIIIPQSVTDLGRNTFKNCTYLKEVHLLPTTPPTIQASSGTYYDPFKNTHPNLVLYVPQGYLSAYQNATNWSSYASIMQEEPQ